MWLFGKKFSRDKDVTLPAPLYPWCSQDVLMQTFEEGMHISTFMEVDQDVDRRAAVADVGSNCMLDMMLVHNLIHSDLHPGNILVRWCLPDGWLIGTATKILQFFPVDTDKVCSTAVHPSLLDSLYNKMLWFVLMELCNMCPVRPHPFVNVQLSRHEW